MFDFVLRRVLWILPVIFTVSLVTFFLMHRTPGGPWDSEKKLPASAEANLNRKFGLDKPQWFNPDAVQEKRDQGVSNPITLAGAFLDSQFFNYVFNALQFDLGPTYESRGGESVQELIANKFPVSAKIGLVALIFAIVVGVPLGIVSALRQNTWVDYASLFTSTLGVSIPTFVSGILILVFLSQAIGVSPIRRPEEWDGLGVAYLVPGLVLGAATMAYMARLTRASMLEVKRHDYVRTARAKGLANGPVVGRHMLRNALIPVITILGPAAADLVTGSIVIETIFNAPGMGREFVSAIASRDYTVIMGTTLFYAVLIAVANVMVDLSYGFVDPRIRVRR